MSNNPGHELFGRLQRIAAEQPAGSEDSQAIEFAAFALHFIGGNGHGDAFKQMLATIGKEPTDAEGVAFLEAARSSKAYFGVE